MTENAGLVFGPALPWQKNATSPCYTDARHMPWGVIPGSAKYLYKNVLQLTL
jgi:hypothetical protein